MNKLAAVLMLVLVTRSGLAQVQKADLVIDNVAIVDVIKGRAIASQSVVIRAGRIIETGPSSIARRYKATQTIIATGKYIMPGLWDMHVHFGGDTLVDENEKLLPLYLAMGVTTVRDCAEDISLDVLKWKKEIKEGKRDGPDIFTSGPKLEGPKSIWPGDLEIANHEELMAALDSLQKLKVDFIKITDNTLPPSLFLESVREARKRGWKVSGHVPAALTLEELSAAGLSTIEHLGYVLRAATTEEARIARLRGENKMTSAEAATLTLQSRDTAVALRNFRILAAQGTAVVPTMNGSHITACLDQDDHIHDEYLKYLGPDLKRTYGWRVQRAQKDDSAAIEFRHRNFEASATLLPFLEKAGVTIIAGTDAGFLNAYNYPGLGIHQELAMMVHYGLSPRSAMLASVVNGPAFFGLQDEFGSVSKGKRADLLLLDGNPLEDIRNTRSIFAVIRKGSYRSRPELDRSLKEVETWVRNKEEKESVK
jgi:imidazolonepropionase-like amidohydrolase